jgi:hypothetical protein
MAAPFILPFTTATFPNQRPAAFPLNAKNLRPGRGASGWTRARPGRMIPDANFNSSQVSPLFSRSGANTGKF